MTAQPRILVLISAFAFLGGVSNAQSITGRVYDEAGQALPGANVAVVAAGRGGATASDGRFVLSPLPAGAHILLITHVGYLPHQAAVNLFPGDTTRLSVTLIESSHALENQVITATRTERSADNIPMPVQRVDKEQIDRVLCAFARLAASAGAGPVADLGCGPGRVAAFLARAQLDVIGIDISAALLAIARVAHPDIPFEQARLDDLPLADDVLVGAVCWYSTIYTPSDLLDDVLAEVARVVSPGGPVLLAFSSWFGMRSRADGRLRDGAVADELSPRSRGHRWPSRGRGLRCPCVHVARSVAESRAECSGVHHRSTSLRSRPRGCLRLLRPRSEAAVPPPKFVQG